MKIHIWDTTVGDDFINLCNKKSSSQHWSYSQWLWCYGCFFYKFYKFSALNDTYMHIHYLCSFYTPKFVHHDFLWERG